MLLALMIALPLLGAVLPVLAARGGRGLCAGSALIAPIASFGLLLWEARRAFSNQWAAFSQDAPTFHVPWIPAIGLDFSLRLDGLSFLFSLLILGIGILVLIYAYFYMGEKVVPGRLYSFLLLFMGSMLGIVLSDNLLLMMIFWEMTSVSSFLLISYNGHNSGARKGARMALTVTGAGGLALLAGVLLIGHTVGTFELSTVLASGELLKSSPLYPAIVVLVLLGAFTKSAQVPFHFWLPHAMSAPTPVSAYLHSATMVKAGVFLLARMHPALADTELWAWLVVTAGLATLTLGALMAMVQTDLKGILAYSTVSHLGLITILLGLPSPEANIAALFHIINHAAFKAALFMIVGIIDHETGTRDIRRISGIRQYMPRTFVLTVIAGLAMAGVPFFSGFLSKEMFFAEVVTQDTYGALSWIIPLISTIAALLSVAYSLRLILDVFVAPAPKHLPEHAPHEPKHGMLLPVAVLAALCLLIGVFPMPIVAALLNAASYASLGMTPPAIEISIWHGFNLPLQMSVVAMIGGWLLHRNQKRLFSWSRHIDDIDSKAIFEGVVQRTTKVAVWVTSHLENGTFQRYAAWMILLVAAMTLTAFLTIDTSLLDPQRSPIDPQLSPIDPFTGIAFIVLAIGAGATVHAHQVRLQGLLMLGVSGLMVALIFARFGAPDLALTQIAVEVVTLAFIMLALYFIPYQTIPERDGRKKVWRMVLAAAAGLVVTLLTWLVLTQPASRDIGDFYIANAVPGGGGTNVVNVTLVDFRAMDTMGEITVITIAALGVVAMLHNLRLFMPTCDPQGRNWANARHPLVLETLSRVALPLILLVGASVFMRGHNLPGGGFIAGLITASALLLQYIGSGSTWVEERFRPPYATITGAGIAIAGLTGLASVVLGANFLTTAHTHIDIPILGHMELASALIFDLGVYLTVVGSTMMSLTSLGKLNLVGSKPKEDLA